MVKIEINGKKVNVEQGSMIIEAADNHGIHIPRFCYHKKLSIAANCRMCLVEVENSRKPLPACATPVTEGMKVYTHSKMAREGQHAVMEFLLINHPLDCPICDQGGECELQDVAMGYGQAISQFTEGKRVVKDDNLGPLISTDMTRCIHCTRCIRFGTEIAGIRELGATGRGEHMRITTYIEKSVDSELSGNVIDVCPVGALTSKPFRFAARTWELEQRPGIAPHDCVGSNINFHIQHGQVLRVVPRENEAINEVWISDRDRFSYQGLNSEDRVTQPMLKQNGQWVEVEWITALDHVVQALGKYAGEAEDTLGALVSPNSTVEECYLIQKLMRYLGSHNIDHRLQETDFNDQAQYPLYPGAELPIDAIAESDAILLIGSHLRKEQPLICHRVRKASLQAAQIMCINPIDFAFNFSMDTTITVSPDQMITVLGGVAKAVLNQTNVAIPSEVKTFLNGISPTTDQISIAEKLLQGERSVIMLGALVHTHPQASILRSLAYSIAKLTEAKIVLLTQGANTAGAWLAGAVPHRGAAGRLIQTAGAHCAQMITRALKAYVLLGVEPELDCADGQQAIAALQQAECVVSLSAYTSDTLRDYADVILPITPFSETSGTYVNVQGLWQSFAGATPPKGNARPAWKVLRVLGNLLEAQGFEFNSSLEVKEELQAQLKEVDLAHTWAWPDHINTNKIQSATGLIRVAEIPIYAVDGLVRRAEALQQTQDAAVLQAGINQHTCERLQLDIAHPVLVSQDEYSVEMPLYIDERVPDTSVYIQGGLVELSGLGAPYGVVELQQKRGGDGLK